jgi:hypothetical protein
MTAEEITAKSKTKGLLPELNYSKTGIAYELIGIESIDGKDAYVLKLNDGNTEAYDYYDAKSFLKIKSTKIEKNENDVMEVTSTYSDFKNVNGVLFPFNMTLLQGESSFNIKVTSLTIKDKVDLKSFK